METPNLFISYSWTTPEHEEWVLNLAIELNDSGVKVFLDKWDLKEGQDSNAFMEKMVTDETIKKVIIVCDSAYADKADSRSGGVGTETQIITAEIYQSVKQTKFVAVLAEKDENGNAFLPTFYKSRIYIDLSDNDLYAKNFEQLLRWIYDKPLNPKPKLGKTPAFLNDSPQTSLGTSLVYRRTLDAIRNSKSHSLGALSEYFDLLSKNLETIRLEPSNGKDDFDENVIESIDKFIPYRNEAIEIFSAIAHYGDEDSYSEKLHHFFESLIPYLFPPESITSYHKWDWDNLKFVINELFIYCITIMLKAGRFKILEKLLQHRYYVARDEGSRQNVMRGFNVFHGSFVALTHRNERLKLGRQSLFADLMNERVSGTGVNFASIMQADFILFLVDGVLAFSNKSYQGWWPDTLVYKSYGSGSFEIIRRSESRSYFNKFKNILGIQNKEELLPVLEAFKTNRLRSPQWGFHEISPHDIIDIDKLCERP